MDGATPFAHVLHYERIRELARGRAYERGEAYFRDGRVEGLASGRGTLTARVLGAEAYRVRIWSNHDGLAYSCTCPVGSEGAFCKHCVAVSLAWLDAARTGRGTGELREALEACEPDDLVEALVERAERDVAFRRALAELMGLRR